MKLKRYMREAKEKELVIAIGLPGTGKSTYIKRKYNNYIIVSNDSVVERLASKLGATYNQMFDALGRDNIIEMGKKEFMAALKRDKSIVLDNTNLTKAIRKQYLKLAPDYRKVALVFNISKGELAKRLKSREQKTGKSIPPDVMKKMEKDYEEPNKTEGFDEIIKV
jgi:predicted kinase